MTKTLHITKNIFSLFSAKVLFFMLASVLLSLFVMYGVLINKTIMNVVARQNSEKEIASLSSTVGDLEFQYMNLKSGITLELAHAKGFEDVVPSHFLSRASVSKTLTYNR